jgi:hypothetical protein
MRFKVEMFNIRGSVYYGTPSIHEYIIRADDAER